MKLKCLKPLSYNTRRMLPGEVFDSRTETDGKILLSTKKVERVVERVPGKIPPPTKAVASQIESAVKPVVQAAAAQPTANPPQTGQAPQNQTRPPSVEIPANWESLHWTQQVKIAEGLNGGELVPNEGETKATRASAIISSEAARRAGATS